MTTNKNEKRKGINNLFVFFFKKGNNPSFHNLNNATRQIAIHMK